MTFDDYREAKIEFLKTIADSPKPMTITTLINTQQKKTELENKIKEYESSLEDVMILERYEAIYTPIKYYKQGRVDARNMALTSCYKLGLCTYEEMTRLCQN